jgi:hypothetical protein
VFEVAYKSKIFSAQVKSDTIKLNLCISESSDCIVRNCKVLVNLDN